MLPRLTRLPLRRCLHTQTSSSPTAGHSLRRFGLAVGGASVVVSYVTWRLTSERHRISLDSEPRKSTVAVSPLETRARERLHSPAPKELVDQPPQPTRPDVSTEGEQAEGESAEPSGGGGAFNPVTGEINWDCPCLGGMAHGPCGPEFREAFSCFVFSEAEPKGIDCVEKFKGMQTCFREHPDIYKDDIMDDDDDEPAESGAPEPVPAPASSTPPDETHTSPPPPPKKSKSLSSPPPS